MQQSTARRIFDWVALRTGFIAGQDAAPDPTRALVKDAKRTLRNIGDLLIEANEAKYLCTEIGLEERGAPTAESRRLVASLNEECADIRFRSMEIQTTLAHLMNRLVKHHRDAPEGASGQAVEKLLYELRIAAQRLVALQADLKVDEVESVAPAPEPARAMDLRKAA